MTNNGNDPVRVAVVGAGYVSSYHLRALRSLSPRIAVVGIADVDTTRAEALAREHGAGKAYPNLAAMREAAPRVIHILTPPASHCDLTLEALEMGCHVLVEKPMASSVEECDRMIAKAAEKGLVLSVNHSARMDPTVLEMLEMVRQGAIGDLVTVHFLRGSDYPPYAGGPLPAPYREGGYPFRDIGIHGLYLLESFLGELKRVEAGFRSSGKNPSLMFDEWWATVEGVKGPGQMHLSWVQRPMQNRLTVVGTQGVLRAELFMQVLTLERNLPGPKAAQLILNSAANSLGTLWQVGVNTLRFATGRLLPSPDIHRSVVEFHQALLEGRPAPIPAGEGRRMVRWVEEAACRADEEKRRRLIVPGPRKAAATLLTGGTGFLGKALLRRLLDRGEEVRLLVRRPPPEPLAGHPQLSFCYGDLGQPEAVLEAVEGARTVYHAGATMDGGQEDYQRGTIWGTRNMIEACLRHGVERLVYVSSLSVLDYAGHRLGTKVDESAPLEPYAEQRGFYAWSKLEAEKLVTAAMREQGLPAVVLRPGQIFGPGAEMVSPYGIVGVGGQWIVIGSGKLPLPLVYVEDVVDALLAAGEKSGAGGGIFQLVDPDLVTQKEYLEHFARRFGDKVSVRYAPAWFLYCGAIGLEVLGKLLGRRVPLTRYRLRSIKGIATFDCTAARETLGWQPRVGVREGLARTFGGPAHKP